MPLLPALGWLLMSALSSTFRVACPWLHARLPGAAGSRYCLFSRALWVSVERAFRKCALSRRQRLPQREAETGRSHGLCGAAPGSCPREKVQACCWQCCGRVCWPPSHERAVLAYPRS